MAVRLGRRIEHRGLVIVAASDRRRAKALHHKACNTLDLLHQYEPARLEQMKRDCPLVLIWFGAAPNAGEYYYHERVCGLSTEFVARPTTSLADIAVTLIHEAEHARFARREPRATTSRAHEEWLCTGAELAFARRLPNQTALVRRIRQRLALRPSTFSDAARAERLLGELERLEGPAWLVRLMRRFAEKSFARGATRPLARAAEPGVDGLLPRE